MARIEGIPPHSKNADVERAAAPAGSRTQSLALVPMSAAAVSPFDSLSFLRLGEALHVAGSAGAGTWR